MAVVGTGRMGRAPHLLGRLPLTLERVEQTARARGGCGF
jgi:hypothetical protein